MAETRAPEFEPPLTSVTRVIKTVLPENIQMTKDAKQAFVRAAGIFIFYLTHCANDFCKENKRQTIYPQDVISALSELGFDDFEEPLVDFLERYKKEADKKKSTKKTKPSDATAGGEGDAEAAGEDEAEPEEAAAAGAEGDEMDEE